MNIKTDQNTSLNSIFAQNKFILLPIQIKLVDEQCEVKSLQESDTKSTEPNLSTMVEEILDDFEAGRANHQKVRWKSDQDKMLYKTFLDLLQQFDLKIDDFKGP